MHFSLFTRRVIYGSLLVLMLVVGWFLHGVIEEPVQLAATSSTQTSDSLPPIKAPLSSQMIMPASTSFEGDFALNSIKLDRIKLTVGLHPGRGVAIPNAADVTLLPVKSINFYNWRGEQLSGWLAVKTSEAPVIILAHGTPGNRVSMLTRAAFLYKHGYNVLLFDFQSYGLSQGVISTLGMVESEDILAAISFLRGVPETMYSKIGVLGLSMGATAAVLAASRSNDVVALVAESCPVDATRVPGDVPDDVAREADQELVKEVYGVDITQARPIDNVQKLAGHTAIFFINGDTDTTTPLAGMLRLYQTASEPKQYWIVPNAGHAQSFEVDTENYIQRVDSFFDSYLE